MISVIICTYNPEEQYLNRAVNSILSQNADSSSYEFFIVDNNSKLPVSELKVVKENGIRVIVEKTPGLTAARECATRLAKGEIIVFVDDDNALFPDYLELAVKVFGNTNIGVISGTILPEYELQPEKWFQPLSKMLAIRSFPLEQCYLTNIPEYSEYFPIGAGMCLRKSILVSYFTFITEETRIEGRKGSSLSSGEDLDIDFFAISRGYFVGVYPHLRLHHLIPSERCTIKYLCRLASAQARSNYLVNQKWKHVFKNNLFKHFKISKTHLFIRVVGLFLLYPLKRYRVSFHFYKIIYSLNWGRVET